MPMQPCLTEPAPARPQRPDRRAVWLVWAWLLLCVPALVVVELLSPEPAACRTR